MLFCFFPLPFVVLMTLLGWYGAAEWLGVKAYDSRIHEHVLLWWLANGFVYATSAFLCYRGIGIHPLLVPVLSSDDPNQPSPSLRSNV